MMMRAERARRDVIGGGLFGEIKWKKKVELVKSLDFLCSVAASRFSSLFS